MNSKLFRYLSANFYDRKFSQNKLQYLTQCSMATLTMFIVLMTLNLVRSDLVIASIASTTFVIFTMPHRQRARTRYVVGGYIICTVLGLISAQLASLFINSFPNLAQFHDELFGAIAVGSSIFCMIIFDAEHPPAAAVALALIINKWTIWAFVVLFVALTILLLARYFFRDKLINLI